MVNDTDTVKVMGDFVMQSSVSHKGKLTAGTLEIGGNLTQLSGGSNYNFYTSGTHTVVLNGEESRLIRPQVLQMQAYRGRLGWFRKRSSHIP